VSSPTHTSTRTPPQHWLLNLSVIRRNRPPSSPNHVLSRDTTYNSTLACFQPSQSTDTIARLGTRGVCANTELWRYRVGSLPARRAMKWLRAAPPELSFAARISTFHRPPPSRVRARPEASQTPLAPAHRMPRPSGADYMRISPLSRRQTARARLE
jgi:hypothetical protein